MRKLVIIILLAALLSACADGQIDELKFFDVSADGVPQTLFTIRDQSELIGGPLATGRVGDVLLKNDKIRVIIEQPGKDPWVGNFGGSIIDADLLRNGAAGQDNFGFMHPLVNVGWTVNVIDYKVIKEGKDGGPKVFRTRGIIDVYDYLAVKFLSPVAKALTDQTLYFSPKFDDTKDPFNLTELKDIDPMVVTEYTLEPGKNYVKIDTTYENTGDKDVHMPVGEFVNGSGQVMSLVPGLGFTPELMPQIQGDTPALIYVGFENTDTSYGYFYDARQFVKKEGEEGAGERLKSTSLSYSGVSGMLFGEEFLKVMPLGNSTEPKINFSVPAHGKRTVTGYFVVGNGSGGSVFDAGLTALGITTNQVSGVVKDTSGNPLPNATIAVKNEAESTVITYKTDSEGKFSGLLSTGANSFDQAFGSGKYTLAVYKKGYNIPKSGACTPEAIDVTTGSVAGIECKLGGGGIIKIAQGVKDEETGKNIPARMTIVGYTPSYSSKTGGIFEDKIIFERPLGVADVHYVTANGKFGVDGAETIRLSPGHYDLVFSHGLEYSIFKAPVDISSDIVTTVGPVSLKKVVKTTGFISADFHLHSISSPDSAMRPETRVLAAAGEGMDILQSSDHDFLVDYGPHVEKLFSDGIISEKMPVIVGNEISPNHIGHFNSFPLPFDANKPCGGALDWGYVPSDIIGPEPDLVMSPREVIDHFRGLPGDRVVQINHIADLNTSLLVLGGWVTSPIYYKDFDVAPLTSYGDPGGLRLVPKVNAANYPFVYGASDLVALTGVDTIELTVGPELHKNLLLTSALPQWFNLLNLGFILTATGDSDSHREMADPLGIPRNFIASGSDPKDGEAGFDRFNVDEYVKAIRDHKLIVSAGPFVEVHATNDNGDKVSVGDTIVGGKIKFSIDVTSPEWAWFDTIEVYANTEPIPADDEKLLPLEGKAKDPAQFYAPYHIPRYYYEPTHKFVKGKDLTDWKNEGGVIKAHVDIDMELQKDTWIVVFVKGTEEIEGYRSLFPFVTHALVKADNPSATPESIDFGNLDVLSLTGAPAWALANPIFVDVDGNGFNALYSSQWDFSSGSATKESVIPAKAGIQSPLSLWGEGQGEGERASLSFLRKQESKESVIPATLSVIPAKAGIQNSPSSWGEGRPARHSLGEGGGEGGHNSAAAPSSALNANIDLFKEPLKNYRSW